MRRNAKGDFSIPEMDSIDEVMKWIRLISRASGKPINLTYVNKTDSWQCGSAPAYGTGLSPIDAFNAFARYYRFETTKPRIVCPT